MKGGGSFKEENISTKFQALNPSFPTGYHSTKKVDVTTGNEIKHS